MQRGHRGGVLLLHANHHLGDEKPNDKGSSVGQLEKRSQGVQRACGVVASVDE